MKKNEIAKTANGVFRILSLENEKVLAIDCEKKTMPQSFPVSFFEEGETLLHLPFPFPSFEELTAVDRQIAQKRYTMIAPAVAVVGDREKRNQMINFSSVQFDVSKQTLRSFLMEQIELCILLHWSILFTSFYYMNMCSKRRGII